MKKRTGLGIIVLVGVVLLICSAAVAETYYVSLRGDDANKGMTEKAAFRTIKKGVSVLKAGDTLIIKSGDYGAEQIEVTASGKKDAPITIKAEKPGKVVLRGNGKGRGLYIRNKSHIIVDGLKFTNFATGIDIIRKSSYITVRRCIFQTNHGQGLRLIGIRKSPGDSHHHTFTRNQFLDFAETGPGSPTSGGGIQDYGIQMYYATNVKATNNYFYGHHHQCISFKAVMHDSVAANNVFEGFYYSAIIL
ncbi:MAG: right-handed parallel beta-helix repeat-containing protein, partial [Phycisphaerae bacterium]|nr:right-handed parallel beta-helix repeat-containing protein [Phycisphaerae bacterium]